MSVARTVPMFILLAASAVGGCARAEEAAEQPPAAFEFDEVRPGVFHARGTGAEVVGSNGAVIVNDRDVLVVDSHMTPAAARALLRDMKTITDKPVRYVVNTHFHFDHTHGNQVFGPDVEIIGHEFTYRKLAGGGTKSGRAWDTFIAPVPGRIAEMEKKLETLAGAEREELARQLEGTRDVWAKVQETEPTPPTITLERTLVLHRGGREIRLHFLGRGHTGGDVVVYLPAEKLIVSGDLITENLPYMGDAYFADWVETLGRLAELDAEVILPGHGSPFTDMDKIDRLRDFIADLWAQGHKLHAQGFSAEDAVKRIDMSAHAEHFSRASEPVSRGIVDRMWELLE